MSKCCVCNIEIEDDDLLSHFKSCIRERERARKESEVQCPVCNGGFQALLPHLAKKKSCREQLGESKFQEMREEARKARVSKKNKKYSQTEQGKQALKRYSNSKLGKLTRKFYNYSKKGDAAQEKYNKTEKAKVRQRNYLNKLRERDCTKLRDYQLHRKRKHLARVEYFAPIWHIVDVLLDSVLEKVTSKKIYGRSRKRKIPLPLKRRKKSKRFMGRDLKLDGFKDCFMCKNVKTDHIMGVCETCSLMHYPFWEYAKQHEDWRAMREEVKVAEQRPPPGTDLIGFYHSNYSTCTSN